MTQKPSLPVAFEASIKKLLGEDEALQLLNALDNEAPTSIRISQAKSEYFNLLKKGDLSSSVVPWCPWGYYLDKRPTFTGDALFHAGAYYVQEASSMLIYQVKPLLGEDPIVALDLCAAPGGKSTLLLDMLPQGSVLVSNEIVRHRANILEENLLKWGNPNSIITSTTPKSLGKATGLFDMMLVDAPCSGEGMFRKDMQAREEWQPNSPTLCAERQRLILSDVWDSLKEGGLLVYSTCTINQEENEDIVQYIVEILGAEAINLGDISGGVWKSPFSQYPCYRMLPHRAKGEGLFMAALRKISATEPSRIKTNKGKKKNNQTVTEFPKEIKQWVRSSEDYNFQIEDGIVYALNDAVQATYLGLKAQEIAPISMGIPLAILKGKDAVPHAGLALSPELNTEIFPKFNVDEQMLISFLSRENITIDASISKGFVLISHQDLPLGFVKHLGNRSNNLYPQEWRIRNSDKIRQNLNGA